MSQNSKVSEYRASRLWIAIGISIAASCAPPRDNETKVDDYSDTDLRHLAGSSDDVMAVLAALDDAECPIAALDAADVVRFSDGTVAVTASRQCGTPVTAESLLLTLVSESGEVVLATGLTGNGHPADDGEIVVNDDAIAAFTVVDGNFVEEPLYAWMWRIDHLDEWVAERTAGHETSIGSVGGLQQGVRLEPGGRPNGPNGIDVPEKNGSKKECLNCVAGLITAWVGKNCNVALPTDNAVEYFTDLFRCGTFALLRGPAIRAQFYQCQSHRIDWPWGGSWELGYGQCPSNCDPGAAINAQQNSTCNGGEWGWSCSVPYDFRDGGELGPLGMTNYHVCCLSDGQSCQGWDI